MPRKKRHTLRHTPRDLDGFPSDEDFSSSGSDSDDEAMPAGGDLTGFPEDDGDLLSAWATQGEKLERDAERLLRAKKGDARDPWDPAMTQGRAGFNAYATQHMRASGLDLDPTFRIACGKPSASGEVALFAYQRVIKYLLHPRIPVRRFLVVHRTGAGKTLSMIQILSNYFWDKRRKYVIFPTKPIAKQFLGQLMRYANPFRDMVRARLGLGPDDDPREHYPDIQLALKGSHLRGKNGARVRARTRGTAAEAYRDVAGLYIESYAEAGGAPLRHDPDRYQRQVVVMDEFHNLLYPQPQVRQYQKNLDALRGALRRARGSVIVGLTATPIQEVGQEQAHRIVQEIKGDEFRRAPTDEGFVSYFHRLVHNIYPRVFPGEPMHTLPHVELVKLRGKNAKQYLKKHRALEKKGELDFVDSLYRLQRYCNLASGNLNAKFARELAYNPHAMASKLTRVILKVNELRQKTIVLVRKAHGFETLVRIFRTAVRDREYGADRKQRRLTRAKATAPAGGFGAWARLGADGDSAGILDAFNAPDNSRGQRIRTLLVDATQYAEGVDFKAVRHVILVNPPADYGNYLQLAGRVMRSCVHQTLLPPSDRSVTLHMMVARHSKCETADELLLGQMKRDGTRYASEMRRLEDIAVDREILRPVLAAQGNNPRQLPQDAMDTSSGHF